MKVDSEANYQGEKIIQIIELQYFGNVYSYLKFINQTNLYFSAYESYFRALHLNRMKLMGANGPLSLSVPLEGGRDQKSKMEGREDQLCRTLAADPLAGHTRQLPEGSLV